MLPSSSAPAPLGSHPPGTFLYTSHRTLQTKTICQTQILRASDPAPHLQNDESGMMAVPNTARTNVNARPRQHQISTIKPRGASFLYALPHQPRDRVVEAHIAKEMERRRKATARARGHDQDPRLGLGRGRVPGHTQAPGRILPGRGQDRGHEDRIPTPALDPVLTHAHAHEPPHEEHLTALPRPRAIATPTSPSAPTSNPRSSCAATRSPSPKCASLPMGGGLPLPPPMVRL